MVANSQIMDNQRPQYLPGPPPPPPNQNLSHLLHIPPPPPRPQQAQHPNIPPPPPVPPVSALPPGTVFGIPPGWQQSWSRPGGLPPPPPMINPNQAQNQHLAYSASYLAQPRPPPPPNMPPPQSQYEKPILSATFIPGGDSFGPGVGIPPLEDYTSYSRYDQSFATHSNTYPAPPSNATDHANRENRSASGSSNRAAAQPLFLRETSEPVSPGPPTAFIRSAHNHSPHQVLDAPPSVQATGRERTSSAALSSTTGRDLGSKWPLERVMIWLAANGFSDEWQETFRSLNLYGLEFLEIGRGSGGRGNLEILHHTIYPQLERICRSSKMGWDVVREREEGKRMRKLIRKIAENDKPISAGSGHRRADSGVLPSASTDGTVEDSPSLGRLEFTSPPPMAGPDISPGAQGPPPPLSVVSSHGSSQSRSSTVPQYKQNSSTSTPSDVRHSDSFQSQSRNDYTRNVLNNLAPKHRHSPNLSGDASTGLAPRPLDHSPSSSPGLGHSAPVSAAAGANSPSYLYTHANHHRGNSTDSISRTRIRAGTGGLSPGAGAVGEGPVSDRYQENQNRRDGQELTRPSPLDGPRTWNTEYAPGPGGKDQSKTFLSKFIHRSKKADTNLPSVEDQSGDSPTSPASLRHQALFFNQKSNASDTALLARPSSAAGGDEKIQTRLRSDSRRTPVQRYILATPDYWNYRLIDVTEVETAKDLRELICSELGIDDSEFVQIFATEPGQTEHQTALSDDMLMSAKRLRSDHIGSLKFYVRAPSSSAVSIPTSQSSGLGLSFAQRMQPGAPSPTTLTRGGEPMIKALSAGGATQAEPAQRDMGLNPDREALIQKAAEEFQREAERKQKAYFESRAQRKEPPATSYPDTGIRGSRVVDFDSPRVSPFEDKKQENMIPQRKPPTAPSESSTLTKVNSLSKKSAEKFRTSGVEAMKRMSNPIANPIAEESSDRGRKGPSPASGIGAALANVGKMAGAPATVGAQTQSPEDAGQRSLRSSDPSHRGSSAGTSPRPDYTWGKGNVLFKNPDYIEEDTRDPTRINKPLTTVVQNLRQRDQSPAVSPSTAQRPPFSTRLSHGQNDEFQETNVSFVATPNLHAHDGSDDDSDDGLFAIPISNKSIPKGRADVATRGAKPALEVDTDLNKKTRAVAFKSPNSSAGASAGLSNRSSGADDGGQLGDLSAGDRSHSAGVPGSASFDNSPEETMGRRESFVSDIWANRPAVENVVNNLDEFFPGVDLDQPYLEERPDPESATDGPSGSSVPENIPTSLRGRVTWGTEGLPLDFTKKNQSDTLGSDESTLKANRNTVTSIAKRQVEKSGNLSRMKSIREVAKGRNEPSRPPSGTAYPDSHRSSGLLRRKSTKMFGANIVQIKPKPGNRLSTLDPIPQEDVPTDKTPRRQATFKIIRGQLIGKGTYGRVYLAMNATTGDFLAVKQVEVNPKVAGQDKERVKELVAAMDQEIDTMQHLEHPNIVQYLGCERKELSISIYLEYISGGSIGSCLRKHGKFEEPVVRSLTRQTLEGLEYLHEQGILHRDLKADNILLDLDGTCKISDFGISKKSDNIYGNDVTNSMQGSVFWMAPEVVRSQGQGYSAKVDIWSLGCVVLEMFSGKRPWSKEEAIGAIFKLGSLDESPPIPEEVQSTASVDGLNFMYDCFQM